MWQYEGQTYNTSVVVVMLVVDVVVFDDVVIHMGKAREQMYVTNGSLHSDGSIRMSEMGYEMKLKVSFCVDDGNGTL